MSDEAPAPGRFSPSEADVGLVRKLTSNADLFLRYLRGQRGPLEWTFAPVDEYDALGRRHLGRPLSELRVLEIGYGARPLRLRALLGMGVDAWGIDMEVPVIDGRLREFADMYRRNGLERVAKSAVRHLLFDRRERRAAERELLRRGWAAPAPRERFIVGDAAELDWPPHDFDLVVSEDVFEHVALPSLRRLVPAMARWLRPEGIALIRPNVFTGITGGHLPEWGQETFLRPDARRRSPPWDHLRARTRRANTYLNELTRSDYRRLFGGSFEVVEEIERFPGLGREFLEGDVARELEGHPEEELFSNQVQFVLRPKRGALSQPTAGASSTSARSGS